MAKTKAKAPPRLGRKNPPDLKAIPLATEKDLFVVRQNGRLVPLEVVTLLMGLKIQVLPVTYGQSLTYKDRLLPPDVWQDEDKCRLIREHVIVPDMSELTVEKMRSDMDGQMIEDLVMTIGLYSGVRRREGKPVPQGARPSQ